MSASDIISRDALVSLLDKASQHLKVSFYVGQSLSHSVTLIIIINALSSLLHSKTYLL